MTGPVLSLASRFPDAAGYLIDLDGTLWSGARFLPGALAMLERLRRPFVIVSNDSEHVPEEIVLAFATAGTEIAPSSIILSGAVAVERIADRNPGAKVMLLGSRSLQDLARKRGMVLEAAKPDIVLLARDRAFTFDKLALAVNHIRHGAKLVVACPDTMHPGPDGQVVPEVGALAAAVLAIVGDIEYEIVGKPEPTLFTLGCQRLGFPPAECLMIGDNPATDGVGAARAGIAFCEVAVAGDAALPPVEPAQGAPRRIDGPQTHGIAGDVGRTRPHQGS